MRYAVLLLTAGSLALASACDGPSASDPDPAALAVSTPAKAWPVGDTVEVTASVISATSSVGLPFVPVTFSLVEGAGQLSRTHATTDASGNASTQLYLGSTPGSYRVAAEARGEVREATVTAAPPFTLVLPDPDPLVIDGGEPVILARVTDYAGNRVDSIELGFALSDTSVVRMDWVITSGFSRGMMRRLVPLKNGTTRLWASYKGASDTITVQVQAF